MGFFTSGCMKRKKKKKSSSKNCGATSEWEMEREGCWLCCVWNKAEAQSCSHGCGAARPACSAWDKKGLNFAAKLQCVGVGSFPNLVQFPAFQRNGSKSPQGRSSPAFHLGNNNREIRCNFFCATCGRTRCVTVPPRNPTLRRAWHCWCLVSIPPMGLQRSHTAFPGKEITCSIIFAACSADLYPVLLSIWLNKY